MSCFRVRDAEDWATTSVYDAAGRFIALADPRGYAASFTDDADGRKTSQVDPLGRVTTLNRQTGVIDPRREFHCHAALPGQHDHGDRRFPIGCSLAFSTPKGR